MNAQRQESYQVVSFPVTVTAPVAAPKFESVDLAELNRVTYALLNAEGSELSDSTKRKVSARVDGKLVIKTLGAFLTSGIKGHIVGLTSALKIQNHAGRLETLQTLEAYYHIFRSLKAGSVEKVTPEMLRRERELIAMFPETHTASQEWIASYKLKVAAKFEGKAARMEKKQAFCDAINAAAK